MTYPTREDLLNDETTRLNVISDDLKEWSNIHEKMNSDYFELLSMYHKERREIIKYLGTISGGAAALAPQLIDKIQQLSFFYLGIGFLCLEVIISATYIIASIENDTATLSKDLQEKNDLINRLRKPKVDFLMNNDYSVDSFAKAMSGGIEELPKRVEKKELGWYRPMDYTGEFIIWFVVLGLSLLVLSLTTYQISWPALLGLSIGIFVVINIISTFPNKVFQLLGLPVDLVKSALRFITKT